MKILSTNRLFLREMTQMDLDFVIGLHQDPQVMRYIGAPRTVRETTLRVTRIQQYYRDQPGYGIWMVCRSEDEERIGWGCLKDLDGTRSREIGYRLAVAHWGLGYASEIAKAPRDYGFRNKKLTKIVAVTHPDNAASERVLLKSGLSYVSMRRYYGTAVKYFHLYRAEWRGLTSDR